MKFIFFYVFLASNVFAQNIQERLLRGELVIESDPIEVEKISYKIYGDERDQTKSWIILVHGLGGSLNSWNSVANELKNEFRVLTYDQRGHGANSIDKNNYSSSTMARDLVGLMDKLSITRAHLVGHSMGGRTVMRFAAQFPDRTESVIVEDMHAIGRSKLLHDFTNLANVIRPLYKPFFSNKYDFYNTYQPYMQWKNKKEIYFFGHTSIIDGKFYLRTKPHVNLQYHNQGLQEDLTSALRQIRSPITFLAASAEESAVLFGKGLEHIKVNKPNAKVIVVQESGHSIHFDQAEEFISLLKNHIQESRKFNCQMLF